MYITVEIYVAHCYIMLLTVILTEINFNKYYDRVCVS